MSSICRKRKGGIKLEGETVSEPQEEDTGNKQLEEEIAKEVEQKKEELQKKKADDLWSSFMSDVGKVTPKRTTSSSLGSLASLNKVSYWRASRLSHMGQASVYSMPQSNKLIVYFSILSELAYY